MCNGTLKMDSAELSNLGNNIIANADSFDSLISNFKTAYEAITAAGTWDGEDSVKFNEVATKFKADLDKASTIVREVGTDLVKTAADYDDTKSGVTSGISSMLG